MFLALNENGSRAILVHLWYENGAAQWLKNLSPAAPET
jgi:hypothetical protein